METAIKVATEIREKYFLILTQLYNYMKAKM